MNALAHGPDCVCVRYRGFEPRNEVALQHGGYAIVKLAPRVAEIADGLRQLVPAGSASDEPTLAVLAGVLARVEAAHAYIDEAGIIDEHGQPRPILKVLSTWENTAVRTLDRLGCTPTSRAALGLDLARTPAAAASALREYLAGREEVRGDA